ncbi:MAG TPA: ATP-binding protein [Burkholderiaceae bacterium]
MYSLLPAIVASIFLGYGIIVACTQGMTRVGASFFLLCMVSALWQGTWAVLFQVSDPQTIMFLTRFGYLAILFLPTSLYHFLTEISLAEKERPLVYLSYGIAGMLAMTLLCSDLFVSGYYRFFFGPYPKAGLLHPLHVLQTVAVVGRGLYVTYRQQKHSNASRQIKLRLCIGAVLIYFFAAVDYLCNYGVEFYPPGVVFIAISLGIFTVAIVRFNLFNPLALAAYMVVANVSHELRTPVNALRLLLDSADKRDGDMRDILPQLNMIARHMSKLVEDLLLLDPDRQENRHGGTKETFDLGREIGATANLVHRSAATFVIDANECEGIHVRGDLTAMRRIVVNLLSNAFKFTEFGTVSLKARLINDGNAGKVTCAISVSDTGLGIPKAMQLRIFDAFVTRGVQGDQTGVGLGLSISLELARKLDGSLRLVESEVNRGSVFECDLRFDAAAEPAGGLSAEVPQFSLARKGLRVLIAEDDPITADAMRMVICQLQHEVVHVSTYYELGAALADRDAQFDLAFIDQRLPGGFGLDIIQLCRDRNWARGTKLVLMTAETASDVLSRASDICDDVVIKPTSGKAIADLLERAGAGKPDEFFPILDRAPLAMLARSGASEEDLTQLYNLFSSSVGEALAQFEPQSTLAEGAAAEVIHRTQSACATMGAVALLKEMRKLGECLGNGTGEDQLPKVKQTFDQTRTSLIAFLKELRLQT